jgi:sulfoxide reductase heme-binding subunit YedZ
MTINSSTSGPKGNISLLLRRILYGVFLAAVVIGALVGGFVLSNMPLSQKALSGLTWLFAIDSTQLWWYVTRSAGVMAYLLLWFSTVWGLAVPSKLLEPVLERGYTFDFHQFISLLSIGFALLHILVLTIDRYLPYSTWQILIPFLSPYRPVWVGIGVISFYIIVLVTVTFYLRSRISMNTFRAIHIFSLLGYLGITLHGFYAGTDSPLLAMQLLYRGTALVVVFFTVYWLVLKYQQKQEAKEKPTGKPALPSQQRVDTR